MSKQSIKQKGHGKEELRWYQLVSPVCCNLNQKTVFFHIFTSDQAVVIKNNSESLLWPKLPLEILVHSIDPLLLDQKPPVGKENEEPILEESICIAPLSRKK